MVPTGSRPGLPGPEAGAGLACTGAWRVWADEHFLCRDSGSGYATVRVCPNSSDCVLNTSKLYYM